MKFSPESWIGKKTKWKIPHHWTSSPMEATNSSWTRPDECAGIWSSFLLLKEE
jgi:hypothetical protein